MRILAYDAIGDVLHCGIIAVIFVQTRKTSVYPDCKAVGLDYYLTRLDWQTWKNASA